MDAATTCAVNDAAREQRARRVQAVCDDAMRRNGGPTPEFQFWRAYGLLADGSTAEVGCDFDAGVCVCVC